MALDDAGCADALNSMYDVVKQDQSKDFLDFLNKTIDAFSQMAQPSMTNVMIVTAAGTLNIEKKEPDEQTLEVATKYMTYWALTILPIGIPVTLPMNGVITSVSNDAMSYVSSLKSDLDDLAKNAKAGDNYKEFVKLLFDYAKKIQWTVIETYTIPPAPPVVMTYNVTIS